MLGLGLGANRNNTSVGGVEARPDLLDSYVFSSSNRGWAPSSASGQLDEYVPFSIYSDLSPTNNDHRILRVSSDSNIYTASERPSTIYYKLDVMNGNSSSDNITGIAAVSAFGRKVDLFSEYGDLAYNTRTQIYGSIEDVPYSNYYYILDVHPDPSELGQQSLTDGSMVLFSIEFANYDLSV